MGIAEFNSLLITNSECLKPFAVTLTKDNDAAQDLLQDTIYRALANKEKYNVGTNIKGWLYTIMRNIFINSYRRRIKQPVIFDDSSNDFLLNQQQLTIANAAETNIRVKEKSSLFHRLPNIFKQPFILYYDGYKYNEIAEAMNEPLGTIKSRIHFARKVLKEQIQRY